MIEDRLLCRWGAQWRNADYVEQCAAAGVGVDVADDDLPVIHAPWRLQPRERPGYGDDQHKDQEEIHVQQQQPEAEETTAGGDENDGYVIRSDLPMPEGRSHASRYLNVPFAKMNPGDSVFIAHTTEKTVQHMQQAARKYAEKMVEHSKWVTRSLEENGRNGIRIWREK